MLKTSIRWHRDKNATKKFAAAVSQEYPDSSIFNLLETELKVRAIHYNPLAYIFTLKFSYWDIRHKRQSMTNFSLVSVYSVSLHSISLSRERISITACRFSAFFPFQAALWIEFIYDSICEVYFEHRIEDKWTHERKSCIWQKSDVSSL